MELAVAVRERGLGQDTVPQLADQGEGGGGGSQRWRRRSARAAPAAVRGDAISSSIRRRSVWFERTTLLQQWPGLTFLLFPYPSH